MAGSAGPRGAGVEEASLHRDLAEDPVRGSDCSDETAALRTQLQRYETAINRISQGVCFFDAEHRLILCNDRYAEIYGLAPEHVRPGSTLRQIAERRFALGLCLIKPDDYLTWTGSIISGGTAKAWTTELTDGRTIYVYHQPIPDGGWVATHDDITDLKASGTVASERISLQTLIDWVPDYLWIKDRESRFVVANRALALDSGHARTSDMVGLSDFDLHAPDAAKAFRAIEQEILLSGQPMIDREEHIVDANGAQKWLLSTKVPLRNERNEVFGLVGIARDITERKRADLLRDGQSHILEMIATGAPLESVLEHLMHLVELQLEGLFGSILLLSPDGLHVRHGAAPSLAKPYIEAVDGLRIGPKAGSCGTAIFRREEVIVADIMQDPLWQDYRELAGAHGYRSCWSTPILSHRGAGPGCLRDVFGFGARAGAGGEPPYRGDDAHCGHRDRTQAD